MKKNKFIIAALVSLQGCMSLPVDQYHYYPETKISQNYTYEFAECDKKFQPYNDWALKKLNPIGKQDTIGTVEIHTIAKSVSAPESAIWTMPSVLTLGISGFVGWPYKREKVEISMEGIVKTPNGTSVKAFETKDDGSCMVAMYYGYGTQDALQCAYRKAYHRALDKLMQQIEDDTQLSHSLSEQNKKDIQKRKQILARQKAEEARQKTQQQEKLNNLLNEVDSL